MIIFKDEEETNTDIYDSNAMWSSFYDDAKCVDKRDHRVFDSQVELKRIRESWNGSYRDDWDD